ncbi:hypothetical protein ENBRE01_2466 [Enteropsectra breve]|nr:hypothetical protein ENBRE01_2466 [Enteropsectra breve]
MSSSVSSQHLATTTGWLPVFSGSSGEDVVYWLRLFELYRTTKNLDEAHSRLLFLCSLSGEAKKFYEFSGCDEISLSDVMMLFQQRFDEYSNIPQAQELMESLSKQADESWAGFIEKFGSMGKV